MSDLKLITIGVYGFTEESFFSALVNASVEVLCDIRRRRGVRGSEYAFANSQRLQEKLKSLGIRYLHFIELAPPMEVLKLQGLLDKRAGVARRDRERLSDEFIEVYQRRYLSEFDSRDFIAKLGAGTQVAALLCVERRPEACHRSLLAERIARDLNLRVEHIVP